VRLGLPYRRRFERRPGAAAGSLRKSGRPGQPASARTPPTRELSPTAACLALVVVGVLALAGCQRVAEPAPPDQMGTTAATANDTAYPSLYTVPPRPKLSYNVEQRRAIVDGLIADRANARYTDQVVRYRTGRSTLPPPPAPPPVVAEAVPDTTAEPGAAGEPASSSPETSETGGSATTPTGSGQDTLGEFMSQMVRDSKQTRPGGGGEDNYASGPGFLGWLRGLLGLSPEPAPPAASAKPDAGSPTAAPATSADAGAAVRSGPPSGAEAERPAVVSEARPAVESSAVAAPAAEFQQAMAPGRADQRQPALNGHAAGQRLADDDDAGAARPEPGSVGIAVDAGSVAIEIGPPALKPAPAAASASTPGAAIAAVNTKPKNPLAATPPALKPAPAAASASTSGATIAAVNTTPIPKHRVAGVAARPAARVAFAPGSAELPAGVGPELEKVLATARTRGASIRIVGEADAATLALDRARAVAIALVRLGARAGDLSMSLAPHATGNEVRLLLAAPAGS
jgi:hypothetical protein